MVNLTKIEQEFLEYEENNKWKDIFLDVRRADSFRTFSYTQAKLSLNTKYNRYGDILPYDHSRVKLKNIQETDYINANHVQCELANRKYILAQGPLRHTCEHFWQMIWEQNTKGIVMLNRLYENGALKCEMYFPNVDEESSDLTLEFGKFRLNYLSEKPFKDFTIRTIECENLEQKEKREIYHCHFTSWPDFGEPEYTTTFLKFLYECESLDIFNSDLFGPSIVHCSAGVGRSGTFVLVDSMLQLYKHYGTNVPKNAIEVLKDFRSYRMGLVQTYQQLRFAYMAILDGIKEIRSKNSADSEASNSPLSSDMYSESEGTENQKTSIENESDEESDSDSDSDGFYENEQPFIRPSNLKRPDTARQKKRVDLSYKEKAHVKNLRELQLKNRDIEIEDINVELKTAINKKETLEESNKSDSEIEDEAEDDESPFASNRRDVETVKVNQPRKPVEALIIEHNVELHKRHPIQPINQVQETPAIESPRTKNISEKEQRISNLVTTMRDKQIKHEKEKKFMAELKPLIFGGAVLFGGLIIHQIYKNFFSK